MGFSEILQAGIGFAGTAFSGGLLGVLGGIGSGVLNYFQKKQDNDFVLKKMEQDRAMVQLEAESAVKVAQAQAQIAQEQADGQAFASSQSAANQTLISPELAKKANKYVAGLVYAVECVLRLVRPALTIYVLIMFDMTRRVIDKACIGANMDVKHLQNLQLMIVDATIFIMLTAVGWWFASREIQRWAAKRLG